MEVRNPAITFSGLASGLDTAGIVENLVKLERMPIDKLEARKSIMEKQKDLFQDLSDKLQALEDIAEKLKKSSSWDVYESSMSESGYFKANITGQATTGTHHVKVNSVAQSEVETSNGYADTTATSVGAGTLSITVDGETTDITVDSSNDTLGSLVDSINNSGANVKAWLINSGGDEPYQLVISSADTGEDQAITIDAGGLTGGQGLSFTQVQDAADASVTVDGITVASATNEIENILPGLSMDVLNVTEAGQEIALVISPDKDAVKDNIKDFMDAYNDIAEFFHKQAHYNETTKEAGPLSGDSAIRSIQMDFQKLFMTPISGLGGGITSLGELGLKTQSDGTYELDETEFEDVAEENLDELIRLFTGTSSVDGLGTKIDELVTQITDPLEGIIPNRATGFDESISQLDDQIQEAEARLVEYEKNLKHKFTTLETLISEMQAQQNYLAAGSIYRA